MKNKDSNLEKILSFRNSRKKQSSLKAFLELGKEYYGFFLAILTILSALLQGMKYLYYRFYYSYFEVNYPLYHEAFSVNELLASAILYAIPILSLCFLYLYCSKKIGHTINNKKNGTKYYHVSYFL